MPADASRWEKMFRRINYDSLDSTNTEAKRLAEAGLCIVANEQVAGRGRFDRVWESTLGGVYVTLTYGVLPFSASLLPLVSALAVRDVIVSIGAEASIKWPNDILIEGKKVGGILIESVQGAEVLYVIGIGINTHNVVSDALSAATLGSVDNGAVVDALCVAFEKRFSDVHGDSLIEEYSRHCVTLGNEITVEDAGERHSGKVTGITSQGYLILETASGARVMQDGTIVQ